MNIPSDVLYKYASTNKPYLKLKHFCPATNKTTFFTIYIKYDGIPTPCKCEESINPRKL